MRKAADRSVGQFVLATIAIALLFGPAYAQGEKPANGSPFVDQQPPLPLAPELTSEGDEDQDWTDPAYAQPPLESPAKPAGVAARGTDAPIYPVLREHCRYSRVYRSEILGRLWFRGEVLGWSTKGVKLPALVTTGPLDDDATLILFGDSVIHDEMKPGGRLTLGWWWDPRQLGGVEASYLGLSSKELRHQSKGLGEAIIARPYWDVAACQQDAEVVAYPGILDG